MVQIMIKERNISPYIVAVVRLVFPGLTLITRMMDGHPSLHTYQSSLTSHVQGSPSISRSLIRKAFCAPTTCRDSWLNNNFLSETDPEQTLT